MHPFLQILLAYSPPILGKVSAFRMRQPLRDKLVHGAFALSGFFIKGFVTCWAKLKRDHIYDKKGIFNIGTHCQCCTAITFSHLLLLHRSPPVLGLITRIYPPFLLHISP